MIYNETRALKVKSIKGISEKRYKKAGTYTNYTKRRSLKDMNAVYAQKMQGRILPSIGDCLQ